MTTAERPQVLLVDDDADDYLLTRDLLAELDPPCDLEWAPDYQTGLERLLKAPPQLCLLDYQLGAMSGLSLLGQAVAAGCATPIVVLTGRGDGATERQALTAGAADYLDKAKIDRDTLGRALRHALYRNSAREALQARDRLFRAVFEGAAEAMLIADDAGCLIGGNPAAEALFALEASAWSGRALASLGWPGTEAPPLDGWDRFRVRGRDSGLWRVRGPGGEERAAEYNAIANIEPGHHLFVLHDVTDRLRAEAARARLAAVVEFAADAIFVCDRAGIIRDWNPAAETIFGWPAASAIGASVKDLLAAPDWRALSDELDRGRKVTTLETVARRHDERFIDVSLSASPLHDPARGLVGVSVIARDITETKRLRTRVAMSDRMASLGTLAAGVAHEINNPLTAVIANLKFVTDEIEVITGRRDSFSGSVRSVSGVLEELRDATDAAERVSRIVRDLRIFSSPEEAHRTAVDVRAVLSSTLRMVAAEIRPRARLVTEYADVPTMDGNEGQLGQVFLNLLTNAAQSIPAGRAAENEIRVRTLFADGRVEIEITDTGLGIAAQDRERIFEPFFTTKPVGVGTGLGLPISQRLVHAMGGEIRVRPGLRRGTTFVVQLPPGALPQSDALASAEAPVARRAGSVLVIDDDPMARKTLTRILSPYHEVVVLSSAAEALSRLGLGERFDVFVSDLLMPGIDGMRFHAAVAGIAPELGSRIVFITAALTEKYRGFLEGLPNPCLEKPFTPTALIDAVDRVLETSTTASPRLARSVDRSPQN